MQWVIDAAAIPLEPCSLDMQTAAISDTALHHLRERVARSALREGRTDSAYAGLRLYRFSTSASHRKRQVLVPGLVVVLQGSKKVILAEQTLHYDPTHCLVLGGETICRGTVVSASAAEPYLAIHLDLPPELLAKSLAALSQWQDAPERSPQREEVFVTAVDAAILNCLDRLLVAAGVEKDRRTIAPLIVEEIVLRLLSLDTAAALRRVSVAPGSAARIRQSMQHIHADHRSHLTVEGLARQVAMSPSHYAHLFREFAGVSPMRFVRDVRLDAGRELLLSGMRVGVTASEVGFESVAHFSREFKRRFEVSPAEYVRRMRDFSSGGHEDRSDRHGLT
ncbi:AraC family transcriptional regulator [Ideonella sp. DXS29W]|uniref:AraC family transcriptional regulator n=1 Tax=Ideonella lacteola TaxID=2984193 RepID=A0ABU9BUI2_9BURK